MGKTGKKSPIPRPSLPQAGESAYEMAWDLFFDRFFLYAVCSLAFVIVGLCELTAHWLGWPMSPRHWIITGAAFGLFALWRWHRIKPQFDQILLGRRGEREVGRMLEQLRAIGYEVFHDIPGDGFNVDHAVIGPGGIFAIETKTISKPAKGRAEIDYDGQRVLIGGFTPDRDPIAQANASADHIADIINRMTGHKVPVRPIVLFPGWWVNTQPRGCHTWVLNPKGVRRFLENEPTRLSREDIALYSDRLTHHLSSGTG
jgi:hypothetical protein